MEFTKATKRQAKLRLAIFGPSGSGKTYTALRVAAGMGAPVALIDTEHKSASKYAGKFDFDVLNLPSKDIESYCAAISMAAERGYPVLIIDSLSHAWHELLQEVDKIARAKYGGNTWGAWSEGTPKQKRLVEAILSFDGHIIATMRTKTEWTTQTDSRGRVRPVRVGLAPEQGKGIEYEFDLLFELSMEHYANVIKDRTGKYQDKIIEKPGEDLGHELQGWLREGDTPEREPEPEQPTAPEEEVAPAGEPKNDSGKKLYYRADFVARIREMLTEGGALGGTKTVSDRVLGNATMDELKRLGAELRQYIDELIERQANGDRPRSPADLRLWLHGKCGGDGGTPATEKQTPFVARKFQEAFAPDEDARDMYHDSLEWLSGERSAKGLTLVWARAILDWLLDPAGPDETGDTPLHTAAVDEARRVYRQVLADRGQQDMFAEEEIPF